MKKKRIILLLILFAIAIIFGGCGEVEKDPKMYAYFYSQDIVKEKLKSPSTAKFPLYSEATVTTIGEDEYRVRAYVDAHNSFGGQIRSRYSVEITFNNNNKTYTYKNLIIE